VDVTVPTTPVVLGWLPTQTVSAPWRDLKVFANRMYVVADGSGPHGLQVFDLTRLRSPQPTLVPTDLNRLLAHTVDVMAPLLLVRGIAVELDLAPGATAPFECDPRQIERAERDPRHKMALVFRSYLGQSSKWAIQGDASRKGDYQIWCGPAMGAFNEWVRGSELEDYTQRRVVPVGMNLLWGGAVLLRVQQLRTQGITVPPEAARIAPKPADFFKEG